MLHYDNAKIWTEYVCEISGLNRFMENNSGNMEAKALGLTKVLIIVGMILVPFGLKFILTVNKTDAGIVSGSSTETVVDNIVPIAMVGLLIALLGYFKFR